ncbi:C25 family cysteine peptidase [Fibrella sp. WM1]|uniref:putative type IX secretion system sortase PorU2 n=1 Tax=Fibrella musci TaxID=3242485 RepID=UPI003520A24E
MNRLYYLTVTMLLSIGAYAQQPVLGNEWINYQQTYYKIPVAQKGLYRLTTSDLQKAGVPVATLDPRTLQLFHRGVEQAIWVEGETDGTFDAADYVEFIGRGNDGLPDSALYRPTSAQPHPYYSLYSDTTAYFLTSRLDAKPGKRMGRYTDLDAGSGATALLPEPYVWVDERRVFTDQYPAGNIYPMGAGYSNGAILSSYDVGEGWMGNSIKPQSTYSQTIPLSRLYSSPTATPRLDLIVIGRTPTNHLVQVSVGAAGRQRTLAPFELMNYDTKRLTVPLSATEVPGEVACSLSPQNDNDEISLAVLQATYPQQPDMGGYTYREFRLNPVAGGRALLRLTNVGATARLYDITTPEQASVVSGTLVNGTFTSVVRGANVARNLLLVSEVKAVPFIRPVTFRNINPARVNFAIIAHPMTRQPIAETSGVAAADPVTAYAVYRASKAGGSYDTLTVSIHQLYNQFNYGERSPLAIRRFADLLARAGGPTKHLLLIGRSYDPQRFRKEPQIDTLDMIPNGGWPGSDLSMVTGIAGRPAYVPGIAIGRLNVTHPRQVLDYLGKLKEHEAAPATAPWRKQMLHLSGGKSAYELALFRSFVDDFGRRITGQYSSATVETVSKQTDNPTEAISVVAQVNRGVGILSMFGHSSLDIADIDIGYVSNDRLGYRNKGRYPLVIANGCASGNFYFYINGFRPFVTDWVLTPDRGAILAIAHTHNGFASALKNYSDHLYTVLADSAWIGSTFGAIQVETIRRYLAENGSVYDLANAEQITLQGDPAVRPFPFTRPDLSFSEGGIAVKTTGNAVTLRAVALNLGRATHKPAEVRIRAYDADGRILFTTNTRIDATRFADTLTVSLTLPPATTPYYELYADADGMLDEERRDNNSLRFDATGKLTDLPFTIDNTPPVVEVAFDGRRLRTDELVAPQPTIEVLVADENTRLAATGPPTVELYLQRPCAQAPCSFERLTISPPAATWTKRGNDYVLSYRPAQPFADGVYTLEAYGSDLSGNRAQPYAIRFTVRTEPVVTEVTAAPNPFVAQTVVRYTLAGAQTPAPATLHIYDLSGRVVRAVRLATHIGNNEFVWDGTTDSGAPAVAGTYLYRLDLPGYEAYENDAQRKLTGKLVLLR